jgi:serine kinase of HPr protein (carbohydrate metabolism regulator)
MATVIEVAAREHRRRLEGVNAAARLDERLRREMRRP